jgi:hypothetical protein
MAAALVVFVVVIVGVIAIVRGNDDPGTFVDDRPMTPASSQPAWLGPDDPSSALRLSEWWEQVFSWTTFAPPGQGQTAGTIGQVMVQRGSLEDMPGIWTPTTIQGRPAVIGKAGGNLTARFEVGDGWIATAAAPGAPTNPEDPGYTEAVATLQAQAEALSPSGPDYWLPIIDRSMANGRTGDTRGYRLGLSGSHGRSYATELGGTSIVTALVVPGTPTNTFQLSSAAILGTEAPEVPGDSVRVRGHDGTVSTITEPDGPGARILTWNEDRFQHRLRFPTTTSLDDARKVAEQLERLTDDEFANAVFPTEVPSDLTAADLNAFQIPGETTPGVIEVPNQPTPDPGPQTAPTQTTAPNALSPWCAAVEAMRTSGTVDPATGDITAAALPYLQAILDASPTDLAEPVQTIITWLEQGAPKPTPANVSAAELQATRDWAARC